MTTTKTLLTTEVRYGVEGEIPGDFKNSHPYTVSMTTANGTESFAFYMGQALTREPTAFDVIHSCVMDQLYLENEPEQVSWLIGKAIEANSAKMAKLFGGYWTRLQCMDEEQLADAVNRLEA